jgi:hypothetical protein
MNTLEITETEKIQFFTFLTRIVARVSMIPALKMIWFRPKGLRMQLNVLALTEQLRI